MFQPTSSFFRSLACGFLLLALSATPQAQQNKALDLARDKYVDLQPGMRENLATIGRYAESVHRQMGQVLPDSQGNPTQPPENLRRDSVPPRRLDSLIDPFEVSPQLREGKRSTAGFSGHIVASKLEVQRQVQVSALLSISSRRGAQLKVRGQQSFLVKDGDIVDFGDLGVFTVNVGADEGVTLSAPGSPQGSKITLR